MNFAIEGLHGMAGVKKWAGQSTLLIAALLLVACGGGAGTTESVTQPTVTCDPNDPSTHSECGTVIVGLTDLDGDFLNYTVDVKQLTLETAGGRTVATLPRSTRINFTDYVDLTELLTVATVPPDTYVSGTITLDYADAEVFVEADGNAKQAVVTDLDGNALGQTELKIVLPDQDQLVVRRGLPAICNSTSTSEHRTWSISFRHPRQRHRSSSSSRKSHRSTKKTFASVARYWK